MSEKMSFLKKTIPVHISDSVYSATVLDPTICPLCHHAIEAVSLNDSFYKDNKVGYISVHYLCRNCFRTFLVLNRYNSIRSYTGFDDPQLVHMGPQKSRTEHFDRLLENLSPEFVSIYNQALEAESNNLNKIAGLGYRKALEFLVKDYCVHLTPDKKDAILSKPLSKCINDYIDNVSIKTLATASTWLGNDEAHYLKKHEERDITDIKKFIKALTYFVSMSLTVEDASTLSSVSV